MINYSVYSNKGNYSSYGLLIGPTFLISFNNLSVYGHLATGYGNLTEPEITFTTKTSTNYAWVKMDRISAEALLFDVGGGLSYALNKKINLFTRIDYLNGSFNFGNCTVSSYTGLSQEFERGYQKYSVINITIGLSLEIQE